MIELHLAMHGCALINGKSTRKKPLKSLEKMHIHWGKLSYEYGVRHQTMYCRLWLASPCSHHGIVASFLLMGGINPQLAIQLSRFSAQCGQCAGNVLPIGGR